MTVPPAETAKGFPTSACCLSGIWQNGHGKMTCDQCLKECKLAPRVPTEPTEQTSPLVRRILALLAIVAMAVFFVWFIPDDPFTMFFLGLACGLTGIIGNWSMTKWVGCRRCDPKRWP